MAQILPGEITSLSNLSPSSKTVCRILEQNLSDEWECHAALSGNNIARFIITSPDLGVLVLCISNCSPDQFDLFSSDDDKDDEKDKKYENFETLKNYLLEQLGKANCNYDNLEFVCVRDSALLEDCLFTGESVQDKVQEDGFKKHIYRNVLTDIDNLMMEVCNG